MTSWSKRIGNCVKVIQSILDNTVKPDIVFMNLSLEEFTNRQKDLPRDLVELSLKNPKVKIGWDMDSTIFSNSIVVDVGSDDVIDDNYILNRVNKVIRNNRKVFLKFIIPCWGVKNEIRRMLDSILCQTFIDYHIVCVDDCSSDGTFDVLSNYEQRFPDKITVIRNERNLGAAESRNKGYYETLNSIKSDFIWVVDADDYLIDKNVLSKIYGYHITYPKIDMINIGWQDVDGSTHIANVDFPIGLWGSVVKSEMYVSGINIRHVDDAYPHYMLWDKVDDEKIGYLDYICYRYPEAGGRMRVSSTQKQIARIIGSEFMNHRFNKQYVINSILTSKSTLGDWIKSNMPSFTLQLKPKDRKTSILMASFPFRKKYMIKCIEQLIDQCDNIYLWLNEYDSIPKELEKFDTKKLHITLGKINLRDNGRYTFLKGECKDDYCLICDDDINYPKNYVQNTIDCFKRNGDNIIVTYYVHGIIPFYAEHTIDEIQDVREPAVVPHYSFGSGTMSFVPSVINIDISFDELVSGYDMELFFGQHCYDMKINVFTPIRPKRFLTFIVDDDASVDEHALHLNNSKNRIIMTNEYLRKKLKMRNYNETV